MGLIKLQTSIYKFPNQFFYGEEVGVYLIELDDKLIFFDIPTYSETLKKEIVGMSSGKELIAFLSHGSTGIADGTKWQKELNLKIYLHKEDINNQWLNLAPDILFNDIPEIDTDILVINTPGHSSGSICIYHKPSKSMFTGDSIYSKMGEITLDNDIKNRSEGIKTLLDYEFENIYPFHYDAVEGGARVSIEKYINKIK